MGMRCLPEHSAPLRSACRWPRMVHCQRVKGPPQDEIRPRFSKPTFVQMPSFPNTVFICAASAKRTRATASRGQFASPRRQLNPSGPCWNRITLVCRRPPSRQPQLSLLLLCVNCNRKGHIFWYCRAPPQQKTLNPTMLGPAARVTGVGRLAISRGIVQKQKTKVQGIRKRPSDGIRRGSMRSGGSNWYVSPQQDLCMHFI